MSQTVEKINLTTVSVIENMKSHCFGCGGMVDAEVKTIYYIYFAKKVS